MQNKNDFYQIVERIYAKDSRYKPDSYEFVMQALHFTQNRLKKQGHLTGGELLEGIRQFAIEQYGPMAKTVLNHWGIAKTQDFGNIVYNMVEEKLLSKTDTDSIDDFRDVYDFEVVFSNVLRDSIIEEIG